MSYNPYAAPLAAVARAGELPVMGEPQPWSVGEALREGWASYAANWAPLTFGYVVVAVAGALPGQLAPGLVLAGMLEENTAAYFSMHGLSSMFGWLIGTFLTAGFTRAALLAARTGSVRFADFFSEGARFVPFAAMTFLRTLAIALGTLVFVVPGVLLALGFANAPFYVTDQNLGPVASLKASWASAEGQKGNLLLLLFAEIGLTLVGLAACCAGLFVVVPVVLVARAIVYTRMSGTAPPPPTSSGSYGYGGRGPGVYGGGLPGATSLGDGAMGRNPS